MAGIHGQRPALADRVFRGTGIDNPELLSGSWEVQGDDSMYGLHIQLTTKVNGTPASLVGVRQVFDHAEIDVYQRSGPARNILDGNWFEDNSSSVQWDARRLTINAAANLLTHPATPAVQLDLVFDRVHDSWSGRFRRGSFDRRVILRRPHSKSGATGSSFVGTWSRNDQMMNNCAHIVQTESGSLAGWSDDLLLPERFHYANGIKPATETMEHYGSIALVEAHSPATVSIEFKAFSAACCSVTYTGTLSADRNEMHGAQQGFPSVWTRMKGDSCIPATAKIPAQKLRP